MNTVFDYVQRNSGKTISVEWEGMKMFGAGSVKVYAENEVMGEFASMTELQAGKTFKSGNDDVRVIYEKVFWFINAINVYLNDEKLSGQQRLEVKF